MACGTPCVVTDVGDAALIAGDTGWIVPRGDPDALARAIGDAISAMSYRAKWEERRAACRSRILEGFPLERMMDGYRAIWREAAVA